MLFELYLGYVLKVGQNKSWKKRFFLIEFGKAVHLILSLLKLVPNPVKYCTLSPFDLVTMGTAKVSIPAFVCNELIIFTGQMVTILCIQVPSNLKRA